MQAAQTALVIASLQVLRARLFIFKCVGVRALALVCACPCV